MSVQSAAAAHGISRRVLAVHLSALAGAGGSAARAAEDRAPDVVLFCEPTLRFVMAGAAEL